MARSLRGVPICALSIHTVLWSTTPVLVVLEIAACIWMFGAQEQTARAPRMDGGWCVNEHIMFTVFNA